MHPAPKSRSGADNDGRAGAVDQENADLSVRAESKPELRTTHETGKRNSTNTPDARTRNANQCQAELSCEWKNVLAVKQQLRLRDPASGSRNQAGNLEQQKKKRDRTAKISGIQRLSANRKSRASKRRPMREIEFHTDRRLQTEKSSHANGEPCWRADLSRTGAGRKTWTEAEHATEERIQSTANRSRRLGNRRSCVGSDRIGS
jgi:hypothetical protein